MFSKEKEKLQNRLERISESRDNILKKRSATLEAKWALEVKLEELEKKYDKLTQKNKELEREFQEAKELNEILNQMLYQTEEEKWMLEIEFEDYEIEGDPRDRARH